MHDLFATINTFAISLSWLRIVDCTVQWNKGKTWAGSLAVFLIGSLFLVIYLCHLA